MNQQATEKVTVPYATMKFADARTLKQILKLVNQTVDEAAIQITKDKLAINEMSDDRCSLIQLEMPKHAFDEWNVQTEGILRISLDQLLSKPLKRVSKDEIVELNFGWIKPLKEGLTVTLKSDINRVFTQPLLDVTQPYETPPVPKVNYTTKARLITKTVESIFYICFLSKQEHVTFTVVGDKLKISEPSEYQSYSVTLTKADELLELDTNEPDTKATYNKTRLQDFIKYAKPLADLLTFEWSTDMPMHITAHLENDTKIQYYIAPRIDVE